MNTGKWITGASSSVSWNNNQERRDGRVSNAAMSEWLKSTLSGVGGGIDRKDGGRARGQWAKMATSTMNGMYVTRETLAMIRQRIRHILASCSTCGSSSVTAFSTSLPPTLLVWGIRHIEANHQRGKIIKPRKKNQA